MEIKEAPSGKFKFLIREALWGDNEHRDGLMAADTIYRDNGDAVFRRNTATHQITNTEIWSVMEEVLVRQTETGEKDGEQVEVTVYKPLAVERDKDGRYRQGEFMEWLRAQGMKDILEVHKEVLTANPLWIKLG